MVSGRLQGQVAVVTGSSRGIGRAVAAAYLAEGARVVVNSRDADVAARV
ncbi:MAG: SDR family NAD(P)-dependent oxidoreductase, partial [Candidatus Dormibacteraeota bacterium]|nr:SDR family NAD(P)-dependent oxidoreductase [Candidatus Dormibacteraeota bacterium]